MKIENSLKTFTEIASAGQQEKQMRKKYNKQNEGKEIGAHEMLTANRWR